MTEFERALLGGLSRQPRSISPKWFYDAEGSKLFERICELPEYYPTRTELALLDRHAASISNLIGPGCEIVEFGAGAIHKVRLLLGALDGPVRFVPVDISGEYLLGAADALRAAHPALDVRPVVGDFTGALALPPSAGRRVGFFPGSSIGNFDPPRAAALLRHFASLLAGGGLLIGVDLVKDPAILHAAYNDSAGITAAFNLNLWARANREAGADFDLPQWSHAAFYNAPLRRIEMHLVSRRAQRVTIADKSFDFAEGDSVHTENSYKYTVAGFQKLAREAGFTAAACWTDSGHRFALHWLVSGRATAPAH